MSPSELPQESLRNSPHDLVATPTRANGDRNALAHSAASSSTDAPPSGAAAAVRQPGDVAPQRCFGEVFAGASRLPEGYGDGDAQGAAEAMCCYLWACQFQGRAYRCQYELQLHGAAVPWKRLACWVCGFDVDMVPEGIARHLLSPSHVRNLVRRTPNLAGYVQAEETPAVLQSLCQVIELDSGRRLTLCHFPIEVHQECANGDPPGGGKGQNPFARTAADIVATSALSFARAAAAGDASDASGALHQSGGAGALAADGVKGGAAVASCVEARAEALQFYIGDDAEELGGTAAGSLGQAQWERAQDDAGGAFWRRNTDGWWFSEGDESWQQFLVDGLGPCWWHKKQGMWFVAKDGLDRGVWSD